MAQTVRVVNKTSQTVLLQKAAVADRFGSRLIGLLGYKSLPPGQGLLIKPCRSVHTCGMKFSIDVGFIDSQGRFCYLIHSMRPYKFSPTIRDAVYVIEAAAGTFQQAATREGDHISLEPLTG
jgi:uncharacterized protein